MITNNASPTDTSSLLITTKGPTMRKQELHPRTAVLNKNQKNHSKKARTDALAWLASNFPAAFDNSIRIRPLKIGIMTDILEHVDKAAELGISKSKLREAVVLFTRRLDYLACLKSREMRIDLQGIECCEVTEEEAELASSKIKKRVEKSVRNARKVATDKTTSTNSTYAKLINQAAATDDYLPTYPARSLGNNGQSHIVTPVKSASVVVKHKTSRQYDPSAVARLKEKLGLSRSLEEKKEAVE
jgi:ProP effector